MPNNQANCIENSQLTITLNEHQATSELFLQHSEKILEAIKLLHKSETVTKFQLQQIKSELQVKNCDLTKLDNKLKLLKTNREKSTEQYSPIIADFYDNIPNIDSQLVKEQTERYKLKADLNPSILSKLWNFFFGYSDQTKIAEIDAMTKIAEIDAMEDLVLKNIAKGGNLSTEYDKYSKSFLSLEKDNDEQLAKITDLKNEKLKPVRTTFKTNPSLSLTDSNVESSQSQCLLQ